MENYNKLPLYKKRTLSENFEMTIDFLKQNIGSMSIVILFLLPILAIAVYLLFSSVQGVNGLIAMGATLSIVISYILIFISTLLLTTYTVSYIAEYALRETKPLQKDVLSRAKKLVIPVFFGQIFYGIIVGIGAVFLIIPGVFLGVSLFFYLYTYSIENMDFLDSYRRSYSLVKGNWWNTFVYMLVLSICIYILLILASIPNLICMQVASDSIIAKLVMVIYYAISMLLNMVVYTSLAIYYFSLRGGDEFQSFDDIDLIGSDKDTNQFPPHIY